MKYLVRAIKYFIWFTAILALTMFIMSVLGLVEATPEAMFREGTKSIWQIALLFLAVSLVYPMVGFRKEDAVIPGDYSEIWDKVVDYMEAKGYRLESEEGETMKFRLRSKVSAFFKMFEDRVTFVKEPGGFTVEGLRKEIVRIISGLEYKFKNDSEDNYSKS